MIKIRKATEQDINVIYELICDLESSKMDFDAFSKTFSFNLPSSDIVYLVAEYDEKAVGFLSIHIQHILHHSKPTCELQELNIFEKYRSLNIGTKLMHEAERIAKDLGLEEIELTTKVFRKRAQEFYNRLGYINSHLKFVKKMD